MEQLILDYLAKVLEPQALVNLCILAVLIKMIGAVRSGLLADITRIHSGATKNGCIRKDTLRIVEDCYAKYKGLWGDGFADAIMSEIRGLPLK